MSNLAKLLPASSKLLKTLVAMLWLGCSGTASAVITCTFTSVPGVAIGVYQDFATTATPGTGSVTVQCTHTGGGSNNVNFVIAIGTSANTGQVNTRAMKNTANTDLLTYNLYRDVAHTQIWGNTVGTNTLSTPLTAIATNTSKSASVTIYALVPALQSASAGSYTDSVSITVTP
jgi:spore coat protein U-like protein